MINDGSGLSSLGDLCILIDKSNPDVPTICGRSRRRVSGNVTSKQFFDTFKDFGNDFWFRQDRNAEAVF